MVGAKVEPQRGFLRVVGLHFAQLRSPGVLMSNAYEKFKVKFSSQKNTKNAF